jgi:hypothetical protein
MGRRVILLDTITHTAIDPALALLPSKMDTPQARVQMLAIGLQESRFMARVQKLNGGGRGPAHSFWQMERGGGVLGVLNHPASKFLAAEICAKRGVAPNSRDVWDAIEHDDILAAAFARLLLWTDSLRLPAVDDAAGGWNLYMRVWRPGRPHPETWNEFHKQARGQVIA